VTEYRLRKREHTAKYTIEIDRMTEEEIDEQLKEVLWSYRQFYLCKFDSMSITLDEQRKLEDQSKVAWDTLQAAFGIKSSLTKEFLIDNSDGAEPRIRKQLEDWAHQLHWPAQTQSGGWLGSADTSEECEKKTRQFLTGNLWPFIKVIRYASAPLLLGI